MKSRLKSFTNDNPRRIPIFLKGPGFFQSTFVTFLFINLITYNKNKNAKGVNFFNKSIFIILKKIKYVLDYNVQVLFSFKNTKVWGTFYYF